MPVASSTMTDTPELHPAYAIADAVVAALPNLPSNSNTSEAVFNGLMAASDDGYTVPSRDGSGNRIPLCDAPPRYAAECIVADGEAMRRYGMPM